MKIVVVGGSVRLNGNLHTAEALKMLESNPACIVVDLNNYVPAIPLPNPEDLLLKPIQKELVEDHSYKAVKKRNKFFK